MISSYPHSQNSPQPSSRFSFPGRMILIFLIIILIIFFVFFQYLQKELNTNSLDTNSNENILGEESNQETAPLLTSTTLRGMASNDNTLDTLYFDPSSQNDRILSRIIFTPVISEDGTTKYKTGDIQIKSNGLVRIITGAVDSREIKNESIKNEDIDDDIDLTVNTLYAASGITSDGNLVAQGDVGIGTSSPSNKLHVQGTDGGSAGIYLNDAAPSTTTATLYNSGGNLYWGTTNLSGGGSLPNGTEGQMLYNNAGSWTAFSGMYWDDTNDWLGIGTTSPLAKLTVSGDFVATGRISAGNDAMGRVTNDWDWPLLFDFSQTLTDFSTYKYWNPLNSTIKVDPTIDLTGADWGGATGAYFETQIPSGNTKNIAFVSALGAGANHYGSGTIDYLTSGTIWATSVGGGDVREMTGLYVYSCIYNASNLGSITNNYGIDLDVATDGTVTNNYGARIRSGAYRAGSSVTTDYGLYIRSPYSNGSIGTHYGLYLENQAFGTTSYAIYSAGGQSYFAGNVGVGTTSPASLLEIQDTDANPVLTLTNLSDTTYDPSLQFRVGATPSVKFTMGVDDSDSDKFKISTTALGTNDRLVINSNGLVGIGTTSPGQALSVVGSNASVNYAGEFILTNDTSPSYGTAALYIENDTNSGSGARYSLYAADGNPSYFGGKVGIGTTSPTSILHTIASGSKTADYIGNLLTNTATSSTASITKTGLSVTSTGTWDGTSAVNRGLYVNATGGTTNYSAIFEGGNVGIGTTSPVEKLEVNGNFTVSQRAAIGSDSGINKAIDGASSLTLIDSRDILTSLSTSYVIGHYLRLTLNPSSAPSSEAYGSNFEVATQSGNAQNFPRLEGSDHSALHYGSGTVTDLVGGTHTANSYAGAGNVTTSYGARNKSHNWSSSTITTAYGSWNRAGNMSTGAVTAAYGTYTAIHNEGAGTITDGYALYIPNPTGAGPITNNYGFYLENQSRGSAINYAIYSAGGQSYFAGNVGIGTTGPGAALHVYDNASADYAAEFYNDGNNTDRYGLLIQAGEDTPAGTNTLIQFNDGDGTAVGSITYNNTQTYYNTSSDVRLKENVTLANIGINNLMNIQIRQFNFKSDPTKEIVYGVIAQELYDVYPQAVTIPENDTKYWQVDYSKLTPLIVKSMQEQQTQIGGLQTEDQRISTNVETLALKTDESVTNLAELQTSVDEQLSIVSDNINNVQDKVVDLEAQNSNLESRVAALENLTVTLQAQIDELKALTNQELNVAQMEANKNDIDYIKLVLGIDQVQNPGDISVLGKVEAEGIVAGAFTVKVSDEEKRTLGTAKILPVEKDEDEDGKDDETGSDGKSVTVKTKAVTDKCEIFVTAKKVAKQPLAVTKIKESESFKVEVEKTVDEELEFSWWIVKTTD
ncbi:MAG: tail fiber domain-containing protein [Candidatus Moranbacteria bacterium]|nr:tail fiber domain-containing protein [Candidatus Moranbacteria bacterium]